MNSFSVIDPGFDPNYYPSGRAHFSESPYPSQFIPSDMSENARLISNSCNDFALYLLKITEVQQQECNIFFSPFIISVTLTMVLNGAEGNTASQIIKALNFNTSEKEKINEGLAFVLSSLKKDINNFTLITENTIFLQNNLKVLDSFLNVLQSSYASQCRSVDFTDSAKVKEEINQWVVNATKGNIKDLIKEDDINSQTRLVITSAIYFKGLWAYPFQKTHTKMAPFYLEKGKQISVEMMHQEKNFKCHYNDQLDFTMLELPYTDNALNMLILLPKDVNGLKNLRERLNRDVLFGTIKNMRSRKVSLNLPRFELEESLSLVNILTQMGMKDLFEFDKANLSGIVQNEELFVSSVVHKAFAKVDEVGTEAGAATGIVISKRSIEFPIDITVNHPFLFMITENIYQTILFIGSVKELPDLHTAHEEL